MRIEIIYVFYFACWVALSRAYVADVFQFEQNPHSPLNSRNNQSNQETLCADKESLCHSGTCCEVSRGKFMCCGFTQGVCCQDGQHCCPQGTQCSSDTGKCESTSDALLLYQEGFVNVLTTPKRAPKSSVTCGDGTICPDGSTCCSLSAGGYGCCPFDNAVCCSDHLHCCPSGTTCNLAAGSCDSPATTTSTAVRMSVLSPRLSRPSANYVVCPDGQSECNDGETCCMLPTGIYGCCPLPQAVCCSDGLHCCPQNTTCDTEQQLCINKMQMPHLHAGHKSVKSVSTKDVKGGQAVPMVRKHLSSPIRERQTDVECPDGQSYCPDGSTCCLMSSGDYGCCPMPQAVCCSDHEHCCPSGTTCNLSTGHCDNSSTVRVKPVKQTVTGYITCPDQQSCPDGSTCCLMSDGSYGCCPMPNAVCCSDNVHCCPSGTTCNLVNGSCDHSAVGSPVSVQRMVRKQRPVVLNDVQCPDGQSVCPDGSTCCQLPDGSYGCCPLLNAVCCSDRTHCCPQGTTCDLAHDTCNKGSLAVSPLRRKKPARVAAKDPCPAGTCPAGKTCCPRSDGSFGCCPLPNAVCCSDQIHCCPQGTTCNLATQTCDRGSFPVDRMVRKEPAKTRSGITCSDSTICPGNSTCCLLADGSYGCCPFPNAVCCIDKLHCCPSGTTCNLSAGTCDRGSVVVTRMMKKHGSVRPYSFPRGRTTVPMRAQSQPGFDLLLRFATWRGLGGTRCENGAEFCLDGFQCCRNADGDHGCCPVKDVCCTNGFSCPSGYKCLNDQKLCQLAP